ncbi:Gfo/Idh/MocA family protein [Thermodesulfobacteriota bacterium]
MVNIGVVGCGLIAKLHVSKLKELGVRIAGYYDIDPCRAKNFSDLYGGEVFLDLISLFEKGKPDAVYILTPPSEHIHGVAKACKYKTPIFLEKPIAHNLEDAKEIMNRVKESGIAVQVGFNWRFAGGVRLLKETIGVGEIRFFNGVWHGWAPSMPEWWLKDDVHGGLTNEMASHVYDLVRYLCGEVKSVKAAVQGRVEKKAGATSEDTSVCLFELDNDAFGSISFTCGARLSKTLGFADYIQFWNHQNIACTLVADGKTYQLIGNSIAVINDGSLRTEYQEFVDSYKLESKAFLKLLNDGVSVVSIDEAYRTLKFVLAVKESIKYGSERRIL